MPMIVELTALWGTDQRVQDPPGQGTRESVSGSGGQTGSEGTEHRHRYRGTLLQD